MSYRAPSLPTADRDAIRRRIRIAINDAAGGYRKDAKAARDLYKGAHYTGMKEAKSFDRVVVNFLKGVVETKVASLAFRDPDFYIRPVSERGKANLDRTRAVLTWEWRRAEVADTLRACLRDREMLGLGIARARWKFVYSHGTGAFPRATEILVGDRPEVLEERQPDAFADPYAPPARKSEPPVSEVDKREDRPEIVRIPPEKFWVAPMTGPSLIGARYCGHTVTRPLAEVKRDHRLSYTEELQGSVDGLSDILPADLHGKGPHEVPEDLRQIDLHIYYEWERRLCAIFTDECEHPLWLGEWDSASGEYPYRVTRSEDDDEEFYPEPPLLALRHPQTEINHARSAIAKHIRQANGGYQTHAALTPANRAQLRSDKMLRIVELEGAGDIHPLPNIPIPPDLWNAERLAKDDLGVLAALSDYQLFQPPSKRTPTAEVEAIQSASAPRAEQARSNFEAFVAHLGHDTLRLLQKYAGYSRDLPIFQKNQGAGPVEEVSSYTQSEIEGDFLVEVYVGSTQAPERQRIQQQLGFIMQGVPQMIEAIAMSDQIGINLRPFVRQLLTTAAPDVRDVETLIPDTPPVPALAGGGPSIPGEGGLEPPGLPGEGGDPLEGISDEEIAAMLQSLQGTTGNGLP